MKIFAIIAAAALCLSGSSAEAKDTQRPKQVNPQELLEKAAKLDAYAVLSSTEMQKQSEEIHNLIGYLLKSLKSKDSKLNSGQKKEIFARIAAYHKAEGKQLGKHDVLQHKEMTLKAAQKKLSKLAKSEKNPEKAKLLAELKNTIKRAKKNPASVTKEELAKALQLIEKAKVSPDAKNVASHHSSSSDSDKKTLKLLDEIKDLLKKCCQHLSDELSEIEDILEEQFQCAPVMVIDHVPFVVLESGKYCVKNDLVYNGSNIAITVAADNVSINFSNHSLTLTDPSAVGISATGVSELHIENDKIICTAVAASNSAAIFLGNVTKASIDNIYSENTFNGILIQNGCSDISVTRYHHRNLAAVSGTSYGIRVDTSAAVNIDDCTIENTSGIGIQGTGIHFGDNSTDCSITNCKIPVADAPILIGNVNGLLIDNCSTMVPPTSGFASLSIGFPTNQIGQNIIVSNSVFLSQNAAPGFDGVGIFEGSNILIENCIIDTNSQVVSGYSPAALHIGCGPANAGCNPAFSSDNIVVRNCIIRNTNEFGILVEVGSNCVFEDTVISDCTEASIRYDAATACTVRNCEIQGTGDGIVLNADANTNSFIGNVVSQNGGNGFTLNSGTGYNALLSNVVSNNGGEGIFIDVSASNNLVKNNDVFSNGGIGINNAGSDPTNKFYSNDSCNNDAGVNCAGILPATLVAPPGFTPTSNGMNICCSPPVATKAPRQ